MTTPDPARGRFAALNLTRLIGAASVVAGMLIAKGSILPDVPQWVGYVLIANGLVDFFVIPVIMVRRWRTPK